ncbi:hypothetical protein V3C99_004822, partial [Haemonchus contortus]
AASSATSAIGALTTPVADSTTQEPGIDDRTMTIIIIAIVAVLVILCAVGIVIGFIIERKRSKEKMRLYKEMIKDEKRHERKRKMKKKTKMKKKKRAEFEQSMKVMKAHQEEGIKKVLQDYLAAQTQTMTVEDSERNVEMPSGRGHASNGESLNASGATPAAPTPRNLGQVPIESAQEGADK